MKTKLSILVFCFFLLTESFAQTETLIFEEDWESGIGEWTTTDESPSYWHCDTFNAYGGTGESWWMANSLLGNLGGYGDEWYQVLDTHPIILSGDNLSLKFYHRYSVEPIGGDPHYDGWDGMNLRVSVDAGLSWEVLNSVVPNYNCTSMYGFGFIHGEGEGIPGWGGNLLEWTEVTVDLSEYSGQTAIFRFAFASDPGLSTKTNPDLFGWQVDDIVISNSEEILFENHGEDVNMTPHNRFGGDLWNLHEESGGNHFASCNNENHTYFKDMKNSLISGSINLPEVQTINLNFEVRGTFEDNNPGPPPGPPSYDNFSAYVFVFDELRNLAGGNTVFYNAPDEWQLFTEAYNLQQIDLSSFRGQTVKLIFMFTSDIDEPIGEAIQIDNIKITTPNAVSVEPELTPPDIFCLEQNYPNPFNPSTTIKYTIAKNSFVTLKVCDILGRELVTLINEIKEAGYYKYEWNATGFASGIYYFAMYATDIKSGEDYRAVKKMMVLK